MLKSCSLLIGFFKLSLLRLRWFVLVSLCSLLVIFNADPAVIPCLAKGIFAGKFVVLALAYSLGTGLPPDVTFYTGSRRDFFVGCPNALAASHACHVTDRWFTPHFSVLARFRIGAWKADVACPVVCQPV